MYRTSGGFVALSPISPQELLMKPPSDHGEEAEDYQVSLVSLTPKKNKDKISVINYY